MELAHIQIEKPVSLVSVATHMLNNFISHCHEKNIEINFLICRIDKEAIAYLARLNESAIIHKIRLRGAMLGCQVQDPMRGRERV